MFLATLAAVVHRSVLRRGTRHSLGAHRAAHQIVASIQLAFLAKIIVSVLVRQMFCFSYTVFKKKLRSLVAGFE